MATLYQLQEALKGATAAKDWGTARKLKAVIGREEQRRAQHPGVERLEQLPEFGPEQVAGTVVQEPAPTTGEYIEGAADAAYTGVVGGIGGMAGQMRGMAEGLYEEATTTGYPFVGQRQARESADRIERQAMKRAREWMPEPQTEAGADILETVGKLAEPLAALAPIAVELQAMSQAARAGAPMASSERS